MFLIGLRGKIEYNWNFVESMELGFDYECFLRKMTF